MIRIDHPTEDVFLELIDFGRNATAREAVTLNDDGTFTIFVNARIPQECISEVVAHAIKHIDNGDFFSDKTVQQIEMEAHGIPSKIEKTQKEINEDLRKARYESMRKRNATARKRIKRQIEKKKTQVDYLLETDRAYRREHRIFDI